MKLFITGSLGQVGTELNRQATALCWHVNAVDRDQLDITDADAVKHMVSEHAPDAVINAAAYTAVDQAEGDADLAYAVNRDGPKNLADICAELDIPLIHYSTDYVFDGSKQGSYLESDPVAPLGVYGASKLAGEHSVSDGCSKYLILRTSWVFSAHGNNFVKTMLRLGTEREKLGVVADQFGKPTAAAEIARLTLVLLSNGEEQWGTYHLAQPEAVSWHGFAESIFEEASIQGMKLKIGQLNPISTSAYPTPAKRPSNSELNCEKLESVFGVRLRPWRESLTDVIAELAGKRETEDDRWKT